MTLRSCLLALLFLVPMAGSVLADGDVAEGEKVFQRCVTCHSVTEKVNKHGPYLLAVVDRPVASVQGFTYSAPMQALAATGAVWDEATLDKFLQAPMDFVKGSKKMVPAGAKGHRAC